ncbi:MAG: hypothetical protein IAF38_19530 [Bacteroidia bacterium]|nr:hypothetical protein [Bacteroidia bacterium]
MASSHQIGKLVLEMTVPGQEGVNEKQEQALEAIKKRILPAIERTFDKFDKPGFVIRIDKLEVDLSGFSFASIDSGFVEEFEKKLDDTLSELFFIDISAGNSYSVNINSQPVSFSADIESADVNESDSIFFAKDGQKVDIKNIQTDQKEILLFFLKNGYLPWFAQTEESISIEKMAATLLQANPLPFISELKNELKSPAVVKRLAARFSIPLLQNIVSYIFPADNPIHFFGKIKWQNGNTESRNLFKDIFSLNAEYPNTTPEKTFISEVFDQCSTQNNFIVTEFFLVFPSQNKFYPEIIRSVASSPALTAEQKSALFSQRIQSHDLIKNKTQIEKLIAEGTGDNGLPVNRNEPSEEEIKKTGKKQQDDEKRSERKNDDESEETIKEEGKIDAEQEEREEKKPGKRKENDLPATAEDKEKRISENKKLAEAILKKIENEMNTSPFPDDDIYIKNAGLVIVQPFLQAFFKELKFIDGKEFVNEEMQRRAVYVLNYLATGSTEPPEEHELMLEKLLCGMEITDVLGAYESLTAVELEESENLLNSVIEHWGALKKSSPEGMRQAFVRREGKLSHDSNGWTLRVERTAFDVLLSKLPWGISIVKSAWQKEMIFVEW